MVEITEEELENILRGLPVGTEVSLRDMVRFSGWGVPEVRRWLTGYNERQLKRVRTEPPRDLGDYINLPGVKRIPVWTIHDITPEEPPGPPAPTVAQPPQGLPEGVAVPVGITVSEKELLRLLTVDNMLDQETAEYTMDWWPEIGHARKTPVLPMLRDMYGDYYYYLVPTGRIAEAMVVKEVQHRLPKRTWYTSRYGGLYDYLQATFGWSRSQATEYFWTEIAPRSERLAQGFYRVPEVITVKIAVKVHDREIKPVPERLAASLRWEANKRRNYDQTHEFNAFIRLPRGMDPVLQEQALADLIQAVMDEKGYPPLSEILGAWHNSVFMGTTTQDDYSDGYWVQYYDGMETDSGDVEVGPIYDQYGIMVKGGK